MEKVKIEGSLKSEEQNYNFCLFGLFDKKNNILKYMDNDINVVIDMTNNKMERVCASYKVEFSFNKEQTTVNKLILNDIGQTIQLALKTIDILINDGFYYVEYELNDDEIFTFELCYEKND